MAMGRPTKYKKEYASREYIQEYIEDCKTKKELVSLCGFAVYVGVTEQTLTNWGEKNSDFLGALGRIKQVSKKMLFDGGLANTYNSTIAKLILSSNHGMSDKQRIDIDGTLNITVVDYGKSNPST